MVQGRSGSRLQQKSLPHLGRAKLIMQQLDRNLTMQALVPRAEDDTHAPAAQSAQDLVRPELMPDFGKHRRSPLQSPHSSHIDYRSNQQTRRFPWEGVKPIVEREANGLHKGTVEAANPSGSCLESSCSQTLSSDYRISSIGQTKRGAMSPSLQTRQTFLLDADDTLWENNIYFERAISAFISFLDHAVHTPEEVREHLDAVERRIIAERGYGTESFRLSLVRCFDDLSQAPPSDVQHASIMSFVDAIVTAEVELIAGVEPALRTLQKDHRLILMTKGNQLEQTDKLDRSGLATLFTSVHVVPEKTIDAYRQVAETHHCKPGSTWMVGNSPRSDINPALGAGLHAVFIPHAATWVLEREELAAAPDGQRLLVLNRLDELPAALAGL